LNNIAPDQLTPGTVIPGSAGDSIADEPPGAGHLTTAWAILLFSMAAVLYLPYCIPQQASASYSWLFGYNNRAAVLLILVCAVTGAVWTRGRFLSLRRSGLTKAISRWPLWLSLGITVAVCLLMYLLAGNLRGFGESAYNIHRVWLLSLGKRPYLDFEWPFGVAQLYVPFWLSRLLSIGIAPAVYLYWALASLAGVTFLYAALGYVDYPTQRKNEIYLLLFFCTVGGLLSMGAQYTLLRYSAPLYFVLAVFDSARKTRTPAQWIRLTVFSWMAAFFLFLLSPETALAFVIASALLLVPRSLQGWPKPSKLQYAILLAGLAAIVAVALALHEFDTAKASGSGSESLPVILSLYSLFIFAEIAICSGAAYKLWTGRQPLDNTLADRFEHPAAPSRFRPRRPRSHALQPDWPVLRDIGLCFVFRTSMASVHPGLCSAVDRRRSPVDGQTSCQRWRTGHPSGNEPASNSQPRRALDRPNLLWRNRPSTAAFASEVDR